MNSFVVVALKAAFLILLWVFILLAANVIRTDLWGRRVPSTSEELAAPTPPVKRKKRRRNRNTPTEFRVTEGRQEGAMVPLLGTVTIGRSPDSSFVIDDDYASTNHAVLSSDDGGGQWMIEDQRSTNGTYVNGVRITEPTPVGRDDEVRIGRTYLKLEA